MLPVYILARTPNATETVEWTDICHRKERAVIVHHWPRRVVSRWVSIERKRPFVVSTLHPRRTGWHDISYHATLGAAIKAADKLAKEQQGEGQ
jgi:hypothetical protein